MFRQKRLARAAQIRCENTRRAFHLSLQQLRQNEAAFQQAQEDFAIERTMSCETRLGFETPTKTSAPLRTSASEPWAFSALVQVATSCFTGFRPSRPS